MARATAVPGTQLAVHRGGRSWHRAYGIADSADGRPVTAATKFPLGSVTKTFTAALAMVLVSDGDLELDAPVTEYLPELRRVAGGFAGQLTPRHLLSHTGGLASDREHPTTSSIHRHVLDCLHHLEPLTAPGRAFSYSNLGYVVAGHLVEAVTGMSWWEAMETVLLKPLGLDPHFVVGPPRYTRCPLATGHSVNPRSGRVRPVSQSLAEVDAPAGAVAASAADLVVLGRLLAGAGQPKLISPEVLAEMCTPVPAAEPFGVADGWGLGLAVYRDGATTWFGHDGTADGTSAHLRIEPVSGTVVALTTNGSTGLGMWHDFVAAWRDDVFRIGDSDRIHELEGRPAPRAELVACIGTYRNGDMEYAVRDDGGQLNLSVDGELFGELTLYEGRVFAVRDAETGQTDLTGRFIRDSRRGAIDRIQVGGRLACRPGHTLEVA